MRIAFKPDGFAGFNDGGVCQETGIFKMGNQLTRGLSDGIGQTGQFLERRVRLSEAKIARCPALVVEHLDHCKALINEIEQRAVLLFARSLSRFCARPFDSRPGPLCRLPYDLLFPCFPCSLLKVGCIEERHQPPILDQRNPGNRTYLEASCLFRAACRPTWIHIHIRYEDFLASRKRRRESLSEFRKPAWTL